MELRIPKDIKSFIIIKFKDKVLIFNNMSEALYIKNIDKDYKVYIESYYIYKNNTMEYKLSELKKEPA